jgi:hypothetical protein
MKYFPFSFPDTYFIQQIEHEGCFGIKSSIENGVEKIRTRSCVKILFYSGKITCNVFNERLSRMKVINYWGLLHVKLGRVPGNPWKDPDATST